MTPADPAPRRSVARSANAGTEPGSAPIDHRLDGRDGERAASGPAPSEPPATRTDGTAPDQATRTERPEAAPDTAPATRTDRTTPDQTTPGQTTAPGHPHAAPDPHPGASTLHHVAGSGGPDGPPDPDSATPAGGSRHLNLARRTLDKAWHDRVLGLSAEAAFWQLLSLPPLFLALLGSLGYLRGLLGSDTVDKAEGRLIDAFSRAFTPNVVDQVVQPTVTAVLGRGRADVISIGFVIALWAGSSATATFVNTITIAYDMRDLRGAVRSRLLALWLYLVSMLAGIVLLPVLVLGPTVLVDLLPASVRPDGSAVVNGAYWPIVGGILLTLLTSFYHLAVPKRLPWHRGLPGALLAMAVFLLGSLGLRAYIGFVVGPRLTYGTLGAPIAALLFFFVLALAVLIGAELNASIEEFWPSRPAGWLSRLVGRRRENPSPQAGQARPEPAD